jgi:hypothetical protein
MMTKKTFDCVEMKHNIQAEIHDHYQGLSPLETHSKLKEEMIQDKEYNSIIEKLKKNKTNVSM